MLLKFIAYLFKINYLRVQILNKNEEDYFRNIRFFISHDILSGGHAVPGFTI